MAVTVKYGSFLTRRGEPRSVIDMKAAEAIADTGVSVQGQYVIPSYVTPDQPWGVTIATGDNAVYYAKGANPTATSSPKHTDAVPSFIIPANSEADDVLHAGERVAIYNAAGPAILTAPVIAGTGVVGADLTVTAGTYTGSGLTLTYQWQVNGVDVADADASTYTVVSGDVGDLITVVETATNSSGAVSQSSNAITGVAE